jgi:hypothetical protein
MSGPGRTSVRSRTQEGAYGRNSDHDVHMRRSVAPLTGAFASLGTVEFRRDPDAAPVIVRDNEIEFVGFDVAHPFD